MARRKRARHRAGAKAGSRGRRLFLLLATFLTAIGLPRQIPAFAAGYAFGPGYGTVIALVAQVLACSLDFIWARAVGQDFCRRRFGRKLAWIDRTLAAPPLHHHAHAAADAGRQQPAAQPRRRPDLACAAPFLAASALGFIPQTVVFALFGRAAPPSHAHMLLLGGGMFLASALLGLWLWPPRPLLGACKAPPGIPG